MYVAESFSVSAKKFHLDTVLKSDDGCEWNLTGWVDVGFSGVNGYDVTLSGPCGDYHFTGAVDPSGGGNNGDIHAFRYHSRKLPPTETPLTNENEELIHQHIIQCVENNTDIQEI